MIEIIFLGTAQAIPTAKRNHTGILLRYGNENILIDCGEGMQRQFRIAKINPCKLTRILITHWHGDHVLGLPGLLQTLALNNYSKTLNIYGPRGTKKFFEFIYKLFVPHGKIKIKVTEVDRDILIKTENFSIESFPLEHSILCVGYKFLEKDKRKIDVEKIREFNLKGKKIGELQKGNIIEYDGKTIKPEDVSYIKKGKSIGFILDTALCDNCYRIAKDTDLLICESTYLAELKDKAKEYKHLTVRQATKIARKSNVKKLILTHLSQRYEKDEKKMLSEAREVFKDTFIARDFLKITL